MDPDFSELVKITSRRKMMRQNKRVKLYTQLAILSVFWNLSPGRVGAEGGGGRILIFDKSPFLMPDQEIDYMYYKWDILC